MRYCILLLTVLAANSVAGAKVLSPCELVKALENVKVSRTFISNWVCLVQHESNFKTNLVTGPKQLSSFSHGIFQISSTKYCTRGNSGGLCKSKCENFMNDDISDDITCALMIFEKDGFKVWDGWMKNCKNKPLPNINNCKL